MIKVDARRWYRINQTAQSVVPVEANYITRMARAFNADSAQGRFETTTGTIYSVGVRLTDAEIDWLKSDSSAIQCPHCGSYQTGQAHDWTPEWHFYLCHQCGQRFEMGSKPW